MSYTPSSLVACPNLQENLENLFLTDVARFYVEPVPFTQYLMSPINRSGLDLMVAPGDAKIKTVQAVYQPRILSSEIDSNVTNTCTASDVRGTTSTTYTIDPASNEVFNQKFTSTALAYHCKDNRQWFDEQILKGIMALDAKINAKNATQAVALIGGVSDDVNGIDYLTYVAGPPSSFKVRTQKTSSDTDIFPQTQEAIMAAADASHFGQFITIGGYKLYQFNQLMERGCCASSGLNVADIQTDFGYASLRDRNVATALGGNQYSLMVANGALQLLHYNQFQGLFAGEDSNQSYGVIYSPVTGIPYDISIKHDCGTIQVVIVGATKVVALPDDMFQTGDHMEGVTGVTKIEVDNA